MKALDRALQRWRIDKVRPLIPPGARVLDIGCGDGALFRQLGSQLSGGIGLDPTLDGDVDLGKFRLLRGSFPGGVPAGERFDVVTLLAVLEHVPEGDQRPFATQCALLLNPGGLVLITVPAPVVDKILDVLMALRVIDGMSVEEHHGFVPAQTPAIFALPGLQLLRASKFQLGLNNLFAFQKQRG